MDFSTIGSLSQFGKTLRLQTQWDIKKRTGDVKSHKSLDEMMKKTQVAATYQKAIDKQNEKRDSKMETISQKLMAGKKLTSEEMKYLREKHPELYEKLRGIEQEEKTYESELKRCRTKEEAQQLRLQKIGASLSAVNQAMNDPAMANNRFEIVMTERLRMQRLEKKLGEFVRSGQYRDLPNEGEKAKALREEAEEKLRAMGVEPEGDATPVKPDDGDEPASRTEAEKTGPRRTTERTGRSGEKESEELKKLRRARRRAKSSQDTGESVADAGPVRTVGYNAAGEAQAEPRMPSMETKA